MRDAVELKPESGVAHRLLADALSAQKEYEEASHHYGQAIEMDREDAAAHVSLARILRARGRLDQAVEHLRHAVSIDPRLTVAHQDLGNVLQSQGHPTEALRHYRRGLELSPDSVSLMNNLAWILATHPEPEVRRAEEALRLAEKAADRTNYADPFMLDTLAAAYANANQYDEAVETAVSALRLLTKPNHEAIANQIRERLQRYQKNEPYRE